MLIDFHVHAFPKIMRKNREKFFINEPAFKLLYCSKNQKLSGYNDIISMMYKNKVDISVIFGFPWHDYDNCRKNNDYILELFSMYPNRFKGFCCVDPFSPHAVKEVERCLDYGFSGVGELAFYMHNFDENCRSALTPIMNICEDHDVPIMLHTNEEIGHLYPGKVSCPIIEIYKTIQLFPRNKIVLAHWGGGLFFFNLLKKEVKKILKNTYYDISASPFLYDSKIYEIAKDSVGLDKIIFGSDFPLLQPNRYIKEIIECNLSEKDISSICFHNASKLLKI